MSYDYSENILVQEAAGNLLHDKLGWEVAVQKKSIDAWGCPRRKRW